MRLLKLRGKTHYDSNQYTYILKLKKDVEFHNDLFEQIFLIGFK